MQADQEDDVDASRLSALLGFLQSWDYAAESLAQHLIGERAGWALVTVLEAWKASCRLRLLSHVGDRRLMGSFASSEGQEAWSSVVRRVNAASGLRERAGYAAIRAGGQPPHEPFSSERMATLLLRVGDVLHVVQPVVYLSLIQLQRPGRTPLSAASPRHTAAWRLACSRSMPWLVAFALEAAGLQLSSLGAYVLEQSRAKGAVALASAGDAQHNARELQHRRALLALFVVRPAARAAARRLLEACAARGQRHRRFASWCDTALELVDALETSVWARYFRTSERLASPAVLAAAAPAGATLNDG